MGKVDIGINRLSLKFYSLNGLCKYKPQGTWDLTAVGGMSVGKETQEVGC